MALTLPSFQTSSGLTIADAYALITEFRLLSEGHIEIGLSIWKDSQTCGEGKDRIGFLAFTASPSSQHQALTESVKQAAYLHLQSVIEDSELFSGEPVYPGSLIVATDQE